MMTKVKGVLVQTKANCVYQILTSVLSSEARVKKHPLLEEIERRNMGIEDSIDVLCKKPQRDSFIKKYAYAPIMNEI